MEKIDRATALDCPLRKWRRTHRPYKPWLEDPALRESELLNGRERRSYPLAETDPAPLGLWAIATKILAGDDQMAEGFRPVIKMDLARWKQMHPPHREESHRAIPPEPERTEGRRKALAEARADLHACFRRERGSQKILAKRAGLPASNVSAWLAGRTNSKRIAHEAEKLAREIRERKARREIFAG